MNFNCSSTQGLIINIDDVLPETGAIAGLKPLFDSFKQMNLPHILVTRSSLNPPDFYIKKFAQYGIELQADQILTPAIVTVHQLRDWFLPGMTVFTVGEAGLHQALTQAWYRVVNRSSKNIKDIDFICIDPQVRMDAEIAELVKRLKAKGAPVITLDEESCLSHNLKSISKIEAVQASIRLNLCPPPLFRQALEWLGSCRETTAVLGDRFGKGLQDAQEAGFKQIVALSELNLDKRSTTLWVHSKPLSSDITDLTQSENRSYKPHQQMNIGLNGSIFYSLN